MNRVVADSNIFQYGINEHYATSVAELFQAIEVEHLETAVLAYTAFEVYRGLANNRINRMRSLIETFMRLGVDLATFKVAAALTTCYNSHEATKAYANRYSDGDVVLAASAFHYRTYILTANVNDFPRPFFTESRSYGLRNTKSRHSIHVGLLCPNFAAFQAAINHNYPKG